MTLTAEEFIQQKERQFQKEKQKVKRFPDISRTGWHLWRRDAWTFMQQSGHPEKVFVVERLRYVEEEGIVAHHVPKQDYCQYRFGYFIVGKIGKREGKWTWGQSCPIIPSRDLYRLIRRAEQEGTIMNSSKGEVSGTQGQAFSSCLA